MYVPLKLHPVGVASTNGHTVEELQRVIQSMKKVVEKLQTENEKLRKTQGRRKGGGGGRGGGGGEGGGGEGRGGRGRGEKMGEKERRVGGKEEEEEEEEEEGKREGGVVIKSPLVKMASEYEKLRSSLSREMETTQRQNVALRAAELQIRRLKEEVCYTCS